MTKRYISEILCQTCIFGCKRGQMNENRCLSAFRNLTFSTTAPLQWIAQVRRSGQSRSLYQVLHRTTANERLRIVLQTHGQKGCEAWHAIVRRYYQRNMSDNKSACVALISNISQSSLKREKKTRERWRRRQQNVLNLWQRRTHCSLLFKGGDKNLYPNGEDES